MKKHAILFSLFIFSFISISAQKGISYGAKAGILFNSAILPDIELNNDLNSIFEGDDVAKGTPQYANLTINYQLGGFAKYTDGFGFTMLEANYSTTRIHKEVTLTSFIGSISTDVLNRKYAYFDLALSYNIFLSKADNVFFTLGFSPSFLLSYEGSQEPESSDLRVFSGFGFKVTDKITITARAELGTKEVYEGSYIHQIMIPVGVLIQL